MISVAIKIGHINDLDKFDMESWQEKIIDDYDKVNDRNRKEFLRYFLMSDVERIYFGSEFCQNMIPSLKEVEYALEYAEKHNLKLSLLTPIVTDAGVEKLINIFTCFKDSNVIDEIIFNDWGVYYLINKMNIKYKYVCGRLLDKTQRDPRISDEGYQDFFSDEGLKYLQTPALMSKAFGKILKDGKVERVEIDCYPQGLNVPDKENDSFHLSMWYPYGYVTTGRMCLFNMMDKDESHKFDLRNGCKRNCLKYTRILYKREGTYSSIMPLGAYDVTLYNKGNTVFYSSNDLANLLNSKNNLIDRLVFQPYLCV